MADACPTGEESSRAAYLRNLDKELESSPEPEKDGEEPVEEIATRSLSTSTHRSGESEGSGHGGGAQRHVIRFEDGDPENPNNCTSRSLYHWLWLERLSD